MLGSVLVGMFVEFFMMFGWIRNVVAKHYVLCDAEAMVFGSVRLVGGGHVRITTCTTSGRHGSPVQYGK